MPQAEQRSYLSSIIEGQGKLGGLYGQMLRSRKPSARNINSRETLTLRHKTQ
jgi:hypothetical protein